MRWPKGPPHLALSPPYLFVFVFLFGVGFVSVCLLCFVLLALFFCFFKGFKGQVRWPKGPPHLALSPPYLFVFVFLFGVGFVSVCLLCFVLVALFFCFFKGLRVR